MHFYDVLLMEDDGSESRQSPVDKYIVSPIIYRVLAPSQVVVSDFFHEQYLKVEAWKLRSKEHFLRRDWLENRMGIRFFLLQISQKQQQQHQLRFLIAVLDAKNS